MRFNIFKYTSITLVVLCINTSSICQERAGFFTGGGLGLQFGSIMLLDFEPIVGYKFKNNFALGLGGTYKYYNYKDYYKIYDKYYDWDGNIYGGKIFSRYYFESESINFINNVFLHTELEQLKFKFKSYYIEYLNNNEYVVRSKNQFVDLTNVLVGGGYWQPLGRNSAFNIMILWNLNETEYNPYSNPIIKFGFDIGM